MRKLILNKFLFPILFITSTLFSQQKFIVDLNNRADDLFKVTVYPEKLSDDNNVFQFAATAPGTYETMDIGRYVRLFKAFDKDGNELKTEHISTNQWQFNDPESVNKIYYEIAETFDTPVSEHQIYKMSGTSIEKDHVLINGQAVFGYIKEMQTEPLEIKLEYPNDWQIGTALRKNNYGFYEAKDFDQSVDSPILLGELTKDSINIQGTNVDVYTYSKTGLIKSSDVLSSIENILKAESDFMEGLPVDHYDFLFYFGDASAGGWEHSYSSEYVLREQPLTKDYQKTLRDFVAHEFFHVVTPLNIHSELVEHFNFVNPVMSRHLWLYEGVTEWASDIIQLRDSLMTLNEYLDQISEKLNTNDRFDTSISLTKLGVDAVNLSSQYYNIYEKGAVVAALLDIRLLELSHGKMGLREVLNHLAKEYGPNKPFSEEKFFDDFTDVTFPEINDFFKDYIKGTDKLPVKEYFNKLGINYFEQKGVDSSDVIMGIIFIYDNGKLIISKPIDKLQEGDVLYKLNGEEIDLKSHSSILNKIKEMKVGTEYTITVKRGDEEITDTMHLKPKPIKHVFEINNDASPEQLQLRHAWMINLKN